ncbi:MAG: hypothetical protein ABIN36_12340 [Ferruginibacter sp.]
MAWKSLNSFSESMKGKQVRFRSNYSAPNLSNQLNNNTFFPATLVIPSGSVGVVYQVRGITMFIGFGRDLKTAPSTFSPAYYSATIQFYIDDINKIEVEY